MSNELATAPTPVPEPQCSVLFKGAQFATTLDRDRVIEKANDCGGVLEIPIIAATQEVRPHPENEGEQIVVQVPEVKHATIFIGDGRGLIVV